ncbi:MAG: hypothetical protein ACRD1K_11635 [Acidimicrobiales bacterium]
MGVWERLQGRSARLAVVALALGLGLAGCGGGDDVATEPTDDTGTATTVATVAYCEKILAVETAPEPDIDFEALSPEQQKEAAKKYAGDVYVPLALEVQKVAPAAVKADIDILVAAITEVASTGDFEGVFDRPAVTAAYTSSHRYDLATCGWRKVDVTAVDYGFQGVPATVAAGTTSFDLKNAGKEHHELALLKKKDGVTETFDQIFELPEEQGMTKVSFKGSDDGLPGETGLYVVENLDKGSYAIVCFLPVGSTPEAEKAAKASGKELQGPPHFTRGMKAEFTVA